MSEEKDVIAIRGLDNELYNKIHSRAKESGKNVSELMNDAMRLYSDQVLAAPAVYGAGMTNLTVSKADLVKLGKVIFRGVVSLRFSEDVDEESIENHVISIDKCVDVRAPQSVFLNVMKRTRNCVNVQSYSVGTSDANGSEIIKIGGMSSLEISKEDLESLGKKVVLQDIDELKLDPDVDTETVNKYIEVIRDVDELKVPRNIFMLILTKTRDCDEVNKY